MNIYKLIILFLIGITNNSFSQSLCNWNHYYSYKIYYSYNFGSHSTWLGGGEFVTQDKSTGVYSRILFPPEFRNLNSHNSNLPNSSGLVFANTYMLRPGPKNSAIFYAASDSTSSYIFDGYNYSKINNSNYLGFNIEDVHFIQNNAKDDYFMVKGIPDTFFINSNNTIRKIHSGNSPFKGDGSQNITVCDSSDIILKEQFRIHIFHDNSWSSYDTAYFKTYNIKPITYNSNGISNYYVFTEYPKKYNYNIFNSISNTWQKIEIPQNLFHGANWQVNSFIIDNKGTYWLKGDSIFCKYENNVFIDLFDSVTCNFSNFNKINLQEFYSDGKLLAFEQKSFVFYTELEYSLYDITNNKFTLLPKDTCNILPTNIVHPILKNNNEIWIGCQGYVFNQKNLLKHNQFGSWEIPNLGANYIGYGSVNCLVKDTNNSFLIGSGINGSVGLTKYSNLTFQILNDSFNKYIHSIKSLAIDKNHHYWYGGGYFNNGPFELAEYFNGTITKHTTPIPSYVINNVVVDSLNNIWISYEDENLGVFKYDGNSWTNFSVSNSNLASNYINKIVLEPNTNIIWFCTKGGFTKCHNNIWTTINHNNNDYIPSNKANNICFTDDESIWYCTEEGFALYKNNVWETYTVFNSSLHNNDVHDVVVDNNGIAWLSTDGGLSSVFVSCQFADNSTSILIYPNPSTGKIKIQNVSNKLLSKQLNIFSMTGDLVFKSLLADSYLNEIDISALASGVYIIKIGPIIQKIIKY